MIRSYGDTMNDGAVQLSFTLPLGLSTKALEAARRYVLKLGFRECEIVHSSALSEGFSFFIAYGKTDVAIDPDSIVIEKGHEEECLDFDTVNKFIKEKIGRKITVVGACTGSDAHSVGIDAIMNMKGYNHHYGLERYPMINAHNLGAQVSNEKLMEYAEKIAADAILVSQVVTQKDIHLKNLTELVELLEAENLRSRYILCVGGPRIDNRLALDLGFDAGFGRGTYPEHVATFIARKMIERT